jgi:hypothetical protein
MKPIIKIEDAHIVGNILIGTVRSHPKMVIPMGEFKMIATSKILERNGNVVVTRNSVYEVESWVIDPDKISK